MFEPSKNPRSWDPEFESLNNWRNRWCMFLTLNNDVELTKKYISSVTYSLPRIYK